MAGVASLSQKQFAIRVGLSRQYVGRLVAAGKLPTLPDKSIPMPSGLAALHALRGELPKDEPPPTTPPRPEPAPPRPSRIDPGDAATYAATAKINLDLRRVQLSERAHRAKLLELQVKLRSGSLVETAAVQQDARSCAETLREQLLALPPRVASQVEALAAGPAGAPRAAAIEALIADEVNTLIGYVRSRFLE